jgi:hypothetical protein
MPRPELQQSENGTVSPATWESSPWTPEDRVAEEPLRLGAREEPLRLTDEHVVDAPLDGDSIVRA